MEGLKAWADLQVTESMLEMGCFLGEETQRSEIPVVDTNKRIGKKKKKVTDPSFSNLLQKNSDKLMLNAFAEQLKF